MTAQPITVIQNRRFTLLKRQSGMIQRTDFEFSTVPAPEPGNGEVLLRVLYLSLDPAMRGWMNEGGSYIAPVALGEVMRAIGLGRVVFSKDPSLKLGDLVTGLTGVQDYAVVSAKNLYQVDPGLAPLPRRLSVLGTTGLTAYFGLLDVGQPQPGETVVVSGAAGATGSVVGQIAKIQGCRAVGIAGGPAKCRYLIEELGFDAAIDYKTEDVQTALSRHCPNGVNVFFDNVGGEILDTVLAQLARKARVVLCGAISQYNNRTDVRGPKNYLSLLVNSARMEGFIVFNYAQRYGEAIQALSGWLAEGRIKAREDIVEGLEIFPETFLKLFHGENFGKLLIKVAEK
jgi:NADPH-dependent curcumin reductase